MNRAPLDNRTPDARATYAERTAARRAIQDNMEAAILSACGAVVEVTIMPDGQIVLAAATPDACKAADQVMTLAGCTLISSEWDAEFGEQFACYRKA